MKLEGRNLVLGMQGGEVRELQRNLAWLGFGLLADETSDARFGETTRSAVQQFQKQNRLKTDGAVEPKTVAAINQKLGGLKRVVRGSVRQPDGKPLEATRVQAFDKNLRTGRVGSDLVNGLIQKAFL
jgi:peptidoglycan hydrolase-like protein with peptidoglycan-binding domain